jgi:hypothetical protein
MKPTIRAPRNARPPRTPPTIGPTLEEDEALPVAAAEEVGEGPLPENDREADAEVVNADVEFAVVDAVKVRASEETIPTSKLFAG